MMFCTLFAFIMRMFLNNNEEFDDFQNISTNNDLVVQKADKDSSVVLVDKDVKDQIILKDQTKFETFKVKPRALNF